MTYRPYLNRNFGIEMEMNEVDIVENELTEARIRQSLYDGIERARLLGEPLRARDRVSTRRAGYYHSEGSQWDVKHDGSCGMGTEYGYEVASPILRLDQSAGCIELRAVCDALTGLRPRVNRKCGLHVTVDCSDFDWREMKSLIELWVRYEPFFYSICPPSRRNNHYCRPLRSSEWTGTSYLQRSVSHALAAIDERGFQYAGTDLVRESGLNLSGWWRHGRIEFRLGGGTVNYEKIRRWTQLLLSFVGRVKNPYMGMAPIDSQVTYATRGLTSRFIFKQMGLAASNVVPSSAIDPEATALLGWVDARIARFGVQRRVAAAGRPNDSQAQRLRIDEATRREAAARRERQERERAERRLREREQTRHPEREQLNENTSNTRNLSDIYRDLMRGRQATVELGQPVERNSTVYCRPGYFSADLRRAFDILMNEDVDTR